MITAAGAIYATHGSTPSLGFGSIHGVHVGRQVGNEAAVEASHAPRR